LPFAPCCLVTTLAFSHDHGFPCASFRPPPPGPPWSPLGLFYADKPPSPQSRTGLGPPCFRPIYQLFVNSARLQKLFPLHLPCWICRPLLSPCFPPRSSSKKVPRGGGGLCLRSKFFYNVVPTPIFSIFVRRINSCQIVCGSLKPFKASPLSPDGGLERFRLSFLLFTVTRTHHPSMGSKSCVNSRFSGIPTGPPSKIILHELRRDAGIHRSCPRGHLEFPVLLTHRIGFIKSI